MGGMDYSEQVGRIRQLSEHFNIVRGAVDETSVGAPILEDLQMVRDSSGKPAVQ
jgi:hypothetical protein